MKKIKLVSISLVLITVLLLLCSCTRFHFITDPCKLDWSINHYYVPSGEVDDEGDEKYILYSHEATLINPFYTAKITDTTLNFGDNNTVVFTDLNGNTHKGTYEVAKYSDYYYDNVVMNFDDGISIESGYFKLRRDKVTNSYIVFVYDDVEYIFSTMFALSEDELVQKRFEMAEWARKLKDGYKLNDEEKHLDYFIIKSVSLGGYPFQYRNHTLLPSIYSATITQLNDGDLYLDSKTDNDYKNFRMLQPQYYVYILIDRDNNLTQIEEPMLGDCLVVRGEGMYYFYSFE